MLFVNFPEANRVLGAPADMSPEECGALPVYTDGRQCISCWVPSPAEREAIAAGEPVWLGVHSGETQPPVWLHAGKPDMPAVVFSHELTPEWEDALRQFASRLPLPEYMGSRPVPGAVLLRSQPGLRQPNGAPLDPAKTYYVGSPENQEQHLNNLRTIFRQRGKAAIVAYLQPYEAFLGQPDAQPAQ